MADLKPLIVEIEKLLSNGDKSAILPKEAVYGSHADWEHHLKKPASLASKEHLVDDLRDRAARSAALSERPASWPHILKAARVKDADDPDEDEGRGR